MNEDNELLLQQLFEETARQQIADDGFTVRVMERLPLRRNWLSRLWSLACVVVFSVLFVAFNGWTMLTVQLEVLLRTLAVQSFSINLPLTVAVFFGLLFVGVGEAIYRETRYRY